MAQQKIRYEQLDLIGKVSDADVNIGCNDGGTPRNAIVVNGDEGSVTMPRQSYVSARKNATQAISAGVTTTVIFGSEDTDVLGEYDTSTGIFTAKDAGVYAVSTSVLSQSAIGLSVRIVSSGGTYINDFTAPAHRTTPTNCTVKISAGGTIQIQVYSASGFTVHNDTNTGYLTITKVS